MSETMKGRDGTATLADGFLTFDFGFSARLAKRSRQSRIPINRIHTAAAAGYTDRTDDIITVKTLLRGDMRNDDDNRSLDEVRGRLQFLADTGSDLRPPTSDLRHNLPS